jgi:AGZA family xanthine/uracil permease-like MFS transporter
MDFGAVFVATCVASGLATLMMASFAHYPIAVAPAMGHNFYFVFTVVLAMEIPWQVALGAVAVAGLLFILSAGIGLRERLITSIPDSLKHAIAVWIGLLIAMIGLQWAGVIVGSSGTLVALGDLGTPPVLVAVLGLAVMAVLLVRGALLIGIITSSIVAWLAGLSQFDGFTSAPPSLRPTLL